MTKPPDDPRLRDAPTNMSGRSSWFIVGGLAVIILVGFWLVSGGVFDNPPTAGIVAPGLPSE